MTEIFDKRRQLTFQEVMDRKVRRFKVADQNKDEKLTKDEYGAFLHPEEVPRMKDVVIEVSYEYWSCSPVVSSICLGTR